MKNIQNFMNWIINSNKHYFSIKLWLLKNLMNMNHKYTLLIKCIDLDWCYVKAIMKREELNMFIWDYWYSDEDFHEWRDLYDP